MCLRINGKRTKRVERTLRDNGGKTVMWKILRFHIHYDGIVLSAPYYEYKYSPGWNKSNRIDSDFYLSNVIYLGIHVFTNKSCAIAYKAWSDECTVVVPVTVHEKDFIAAGTDYDAVFMKVFLKKEDYDKTIKIIQKEYNI